MLNKMNVGEVSVFRGSVEIKPPPSSQHSLLMTPVTLKRPDSIYWHEAEAAIDTGSTLAFVVSPKLAEKLKLKVTDTDELNGLGGVSKAQIAAIDLVVQGVSFMNCECHIVEQKVDCVVGLKLLKHFILLLNAEECELIPNTENLKLEEIKRAALEAKEKHADSA